MLLCNISQTRAPRAQIALTRFLLAPQHASCTIDPAAQYCSSSHASTPVLCRKKIRVKTKQDQNKKMMRGSKHSQMRGVAGRLGRKW